MEPHSANPLEVFVQYFVYNLPGRRRTHFRVPILDTQGSSRTASTVMGNSGNSALFTSATADI